MERVFWVFSHFRGESHTWSTARKCVCKRALLYRTFPHSSGSWAGLRPLRPSHREKRQNDFAWDLPYHDHCHAVNKHHELVRYQHRWLLDPST